jgi:hypothetical protein
LIGTETKSPNIVDRYEREAAVTCLVISTGNSTGARLIKMILRSFGEQYHRKCKS